MSKLLSPHSGSSCFIAEGTGLVRHDLPLENPQCVPNHPLVLQVPRNIFQEDSLHALPRDRDEAEQPAAPQTSYCSAELS